MVCTKAVPLGIVLVVAVSSLAPAVGEIETRRAARKDLGINLGNGLGIGIGIGVGAGVGAGGSGSGSGSASSSGSGSS
mgnify:CR=1 FL=1